MRYSIIGATLVNVLFAAIAFAADDSVIDTPRRAKVNVRIHGLYIKNQAGAVDKNKTANNISAFVGIVLNWLDLQL